jgi:hypothetical protein
VKQLLLALLVLSALCGATQLGMPVAHAQVASAQTATGSGSGGNAAPAGEGPSTEFLPDPRQWAADVFNQVMVSLLQGIANALHAVISAVLNSSLNVISQTPPVATYSSPIVRQLWTVVRMIANAALVLAAAWGGFNLMAREHLGTEYHEMLVLLPRLAIGAALVNTSLSWGQLAIDANNALCRAIGDVTLPAWQAADGGSQLLATVIAVLIYLVAGLLLIIQQLMRVALVDVLLVVAPIALLCWILPQTQSWAKQWSSLFFGTVFTQFIQVIALKLGGSLMTDLTPVAGDTALLELFLGVALVALTLKVPGLMRGHLGDGLGFVRYFAYRQLARGLESRTGASNASKGAAA